MKGRSLEDYSLSEFLPESWSDDSDGETATRTHKGRHDPFRKADNVSDEASEGDALKRDSALGPTGDMSAIWNPSREQWIVIWVCTMAAWLLWSSDNGILGYTPLFGHNTDRRFGALAIVIGVLLTWQLEPRRKK